MTIDAVQFIAGSLGCPSANSLMHTGVFKGQVPCPFARIRSGHLFRPNRRKQAHRLSILRCPGKHDIIRQHPPGWQLNCISWLAGLPREERQWVPHT